MGQKSDEFPSFGDVYDGRKMRAFVESLERIFARKSSKKRRTRIVTAASYDVVQEDEILLVDRTATGVCTINMPSAPLWTGRSLTVYDRGNNASVNNITVDGAGSEEINGSTTRVISVNRSSETYTSDGTGWFVEAVA